MLREERRERGREGGQMRSELYMKSALAASSNETTLCYFEKEEKER